MKHTTKPLSITPKLGRKHRNNKWTNIIKTTNIVIIILVPYIFLLKLQYLQRLKIYYSKNMNAFRQRH